MVSNPSLFFMPCTDPRVNVYQFGSLGSVVNVNYLKINNLVVVLPESGSLWITFSGLLSHFWITAATALS